MRGPFPHREPSASARRKAKYREPVYRAASEYGAGMVFADPGTRRFGPPSAMPFVAIFDDRPGQGPGAFDAPSLYAVLCRVHGVMVLTGGGLEREPYGLAATVLRSGVSILVVETDRAHGQDWRRLAHGYAQTTVPVIVLP